MMDDVKQGLFNTIIVKAFSRLGRDYIGVADYVERIFPLLGIRFISVNNHFDSGSATGASMDLGLAEEIPDPNRIETQIRVMKEERIRQYEGYADGMITRKEYLAKKQKIDGKIEKLEAELEETRELLAEEQRILEEIK